MFSSTSKLPHFLLSSCLQACLVWMDGWVGGWVEEKRRRYCTFGG